MDIAEYNMYISRMENNAASKTPFPSVHLDYVDLVGLGPWWETAEQIRPVWKLYWNDSDGAAVTCGGEYRILREGQIYLIAPNTHYTAHYRGPVNNFYIHFTLPVSCRLLPRGIWTADAPFSLKTIQEHARKSPWTFRDILLFQELVIHAVRQLPEELFLEEKHSPLAEVFTWLDGHLAEECRNDRLAALAGISVDTLTRLFRTETGRSPQEYVRKMRTGRAAVLLRQTDLTIDEIAEQTGFYDRAHFHRLFRAASGETPAAFRKAFSR